MGSFDTCFSSLFDFFMLVLMASFRFYINLFSQFTPRPLAQAFIKCYRIEVHLFCCLICLFVCFFFNCFGFALFCFLVICTSFLLAVVPEIDSNHACACISLHHLLTWHGKPLRSGSSFPLLVLPLHKRRLVAGGRERTAAWTGAG